jgi:2-dehydropantoate 2-reductase
MGKRIAVLGTGAIGSSVGADLTEAGEDVILVDQWPAHVEAMKAGGLHVRMPDREVHAQVRAHHLCELAGLNRTLDLVFCAAKSYDTHWLAHFIKPYLSPGGVFVSLQNSLNEETTVPILGFERVVGSVIELGGELFEPGRVKRFTTRARTWFAVGELHGRLTPRVSEIASVLSAVGRCEVTANVWGGKWSKLTVNCMEQAVAGILGIYDFEVAENGQVLALCVRLGRECVQVGTTLGYRLEPIFGLAAEEFLASTDDGLQALLFTLFSHVGREARNSVLQDHLKGRRSEVARLNGLVVRKGQEAGVPTPLNAAVTELSRQIEERKLTPGRHNMPLLEELFKM